MALIREKISTVLCVSVNDLLQEDMQAQPEDLDDEWLRLKIVHEAMESGVTKEQIKEYLEFNKWRDKQDN